MAFLAVENLSKSYHKPIISHLSYAWSKGKIHAIVGRSGAGKSTLLRCLAGLEPIDSGQIFLNGTDLKTLKKYQVRLLKEKIGFIFQSYSLLERRTVLENVLLPAELCKKKESSYIDEARALLESVGLKGYEDAYPNHISGGQRQRVAIARALILKPALVLCDEITSALDVETAYDISKLIKDVSRERNVTLILVTHDWSVVKHIADEVCVLEEGVMVESGSTINVLRHPKHPVVKKMVEHFYGTQLPDHLREVLHSDPVSKDYAICRLDFGAANSIQPIMSDVFRGTSLPISILSGALDHVGNDLFGSLLVAVPLDKVSEIATILQTHLVETYVIGYVPWT